MIKLKNKGFTLVELVAIIVVLAAIFLLAFPTLLKTSTNAENAKFAVVENVLCEAGKSYLYTETPTFDDGTAILNVSDLIEYGVVDPDMKNPLDDGPIGDDRLILTDTGSCQYQPIHRIQVPTTETACRTDLVYNGDSIFLLKNPNYDYVSYSIYNGVNAGEYTITATLYDDYGPAIWSDGTDEEKEFTCTIEKANDSIIIADVTREYSGNATGSTVTTTSGVVATETYYSDSECTIEVQPINVGEYYVIASTQGNGNYNGTTTQCKKALTINPLVVTTNVTCAASKIYNGTTNASCSIAVTNIKGNDVLSITGTCSYNNANVGTNKPISCSSLALSGASKSNYTVTGATATTTGNINNARITFNPGDGTLSGTSPLYARKGQTGVYTGLNNSSGGTIPTATRTGYVFSGWYTSSNSKIIDSARNIIASVSNYTDSDKKWLITSNQTFTANWTPGIYTITFDKQNGTGGTNSIYEKYNTGYYTDSATTTAMTSSTSINIPTRTGYTFDGYYTAANGGTKYIDADGILTSNASTTQFADDGTLYAHWTKPVADLAYTTSPASKIYTGGALTFDTLTVKDGNTTLTSGTDFAVSYADNTNVGTATATISGRSVYNSTTKAYYTGTTTKTFTINNFKLIFNPGDGTLSGTSPLYSRKGQSGVFTELNNSTPASVPTATRTGYTFDGWKSPGGVKIINSDGTLVSNINGWVNTNGTWLLTSDQTLTAILSKATYTITYNLDGGSVSTANPTSYDIDTATFTLTNPTKIGHTFIGWTGSNGSTPQTTVTVAKGSTGNKTYTANWSVNPYTATFYSNQIMNGDFAGAAGWTVVNAATIALDTTVKNGTMNSLRISTEGSGYDGVITNYKPNFKPNTTYKISLKVYRDSSSTYGDVSKAFRAYMTEAQADGTVVKYNHGITITTSNLPDKTWKEFTYTFTTSSTSTQFLYLRLDFLNTSGKANIWVSDVRAEEVVERTVNYNTALGTLPTTTRTGYTSGGYYTGQNGTGTNISSTTKIGAADTAYYEKWTPNTLTVNLYANGAIYTNSGTIANELLGTNTLSYDGTVANTWPMDYAYPYGYNLVRAGYTKDGYYHIGSGTASSKVTQDLGETTVMGAANKLGVLSQLQSGNTTVNLYGGWTENTYTLTVNPNGGSYNNTTSNTSYTLKYSDVQNIPTPTKTGYDFTGWTELSGGIYTNGLASVTKYNNVSGTTVAVASKTKSSDNPLTGMSNEYSITNSGATNTSPGLGGFYHTVTSAANKVYVHVFVAKLPSGYYFHNANNAIGTGGTTQWLTSNAGTGSWKTYAYKVTTGSSAPFGTFGHVFVSTNPRNVWVTGVGATGETGSYTAYLAYSNIFDVTNNNAGIGQLDGSATLTAGWSAKTITIQLDGNEGSGGTASVNITYNTAQGNYPSITLPTRTGYSFNGYWDTSAASGGTQWYNASGNSLRTFNLTANATWWARWSANTYYVYYNQGTATGGWNATTYATQSRTYPNATTLRTNSMTKSNTTANGYTVTYAQGTATGGWNATTYATQTSTNTTSYTANGWTTGSTNTNDRDYANGASFGSSSTTNLTLYPNFTTSTSNGGVTTRTNSMTKSNTNLGTVTFKYQDGSTADTTSTGYTSYTANGWTTTSGSTSRTYTNGAATGALSGNITLYPCFSQSNTSASFPSPSRSGYTFDGWYDASSGGNKVTSYTGTAAKTLYAHWSGNTYYVYYNQGLATGGWNATTYATQSRTYPNATTLRTNSMTKSNTTANGYTVTYAQGTATGGWNATTYAAQTATNTISYTANGWTTGSTNTNDSDYANGASFGSSSTTNLTLYPNFTTSTSYGGVTTRTNSMTKSNTALGTVTFKYQDGSTADTTSAGYTSYTANGWTTTSGSTSRTYANGAATGALSGNVTLYPCFSQSTTSASFPSPTRSGYTFDGWYDAASGGNKVTSYTGTTAKTLYAHWTALALTMNAPTPTGTSATGTGTTTTSGFMVGATVTFTCSGQSGNYPKTLQISGQTAVSNSSNASSISATYTISSPSTSFTISATCTGAVGNTKTVTSVAKPIYRKFQLLYEKNGASAIGSTSSSVQTLAANSTSGDGGTTFTLPSSITCVNNGRSCTSSGWDLETAKVCPRFAKGAKVNVCTTNTSGCSGTAAKSSAVPGSCAAAGSTGTIQLGEEYTARYVYAISYSTFNNPTKLSTAVTVPSSVTSTKNDGNIYIYGSFTPSNVSITMTNRCYNRSDDKKIFALNGGGGTNNVATICSASQSSCAKVASTDIFKSNYSFGCMSSAGGSSFVQL